MTDIIERLRAKDCCDTANCNCDEAADEIERLRKAEKEALDLAERHMNEKHAALSEIKWLRAALAECRDELDGYYDRENPGDDPINTRRRHNNYTDNPARIALEQGK